MFPSRQYPPWQRKAEQPARRHADRVAHHPDIEPNRDGPGEARSVAQRGPGTVVALVARSIVVGSPEISRRPWLGRARAALRTLGAFVRIPTDGLRMLRLLSPVADISRRTPWAAMGQQRRSRLACRGQSPVSRKRNSAESRWSSRTPNDIFNATIDTIPRSGSGLGEIQ
jgi:hypothetical protein